MNLEHYHYFNSHDYRAYEFYSEGPKGRITKLVLFSKVPDTEPLFTIWLLVTKTP
jgi:hypothetical protein